MKRQWIIFKQVALICRMCAYARCRGGLHAAVCSQPNIWLYYLDGPGDASDASAARCPHCSQGERASNLFCPNTLATTCRTEFLYVVARIHGVFK